MPEGAVEFFDNYINYPDLINAASWAFDSIMSKNKIKSFIYLGVAWDALLGSAGGSANITTTMGDRLAYLISRSRSERDEVLEKFKEFYRIRSKVVHGRVAWINEEETDIYNWGLFVFEKAFNRELTLLIGQSSQNHIVDKA